MFAVSGPGFLGLSTALSECSPSIIVDFWQFLKRVPTMGAANLSLRQAHKLDIPSKCSEL